MRALPAVAAFIFAFAITSPSHAETKLQKQCYAAKIVPEDVTKLSDLPLGCHFGVVKTFNGVKFCVGCPSDAYPIGRYRCAKCQQGTSWDPRLKKCCSKPPGPQIP